MPGALHDAAPGSAERPPLEPDGATRRRTIGGGCPVPPVRYPLDLRGTLRALGADAASPVLDGTLSGSGEDALALALASACDVSALQPGDAVLVPDFVCSSVPRAVERAGLTVVRGALDAARWTYAAAALHAALDAGVRAVVAVSYFGLPVGGDAAGAAALEAAARDVLVVEDLAQAYGLDAAARVHGARVAIFSFGRGKSLPLAWGGLVAARDARLAEAVVARAAPGARAGMLGDVAHLALAQLLRALLHPAVWRFVPLPRARGGSADEESRARRAPGRVVARYLAAAAASHPLVVAERRRNALALRERLAGEVAGGIGLPDAGSLRAGVALRLPVLFERADDARAVRCALAEQRIVKGPNDWDDYGRASAAAAAIADRLVTLPTHPGSEHAARRAIAVIAQRLGA